MHDIIITHCLLTLPDSLAQREKLLVALSQFAPLGELRNRVKVLRLQIEEHKKSQLEFTLDLKPST